MSEQKDHVVCKPNWEGKCEVCGQSPTVNLFDAKTGEFKHGFELCGPCCFGEAKAIDPANW